MASQANSMELSPSPTAAAAAAASDMAGATDSAQTATQEPARSKRIDLKRWNAVSLWSWDIEVDNCAICRNLIMEYCIECQANRGGSQQSPGDGHDECTVAWGVCNHAFHFHCITRWLRTRPSCPLDNQDWQFQEFGRNTQ